MAALTKPSTEGDVLKFDLDKNYTREVVTLAAGTNYKIGSVLGQVTATGKYKLSPLTGSTGEQTATAVLIAAVDATSADAAGVVIRRGPAILAYDALVFDATVSNANAIATKVGQLVAAGLVVRKNA